jgi:hypothetical protein
MSASVCGKLHDGILWVRSCEIVKRLPRWRGRRVELKGVQVRIEGDVMPCARYACAVRDAVAQCLLVVGDAFVGSLDACRLSWIDELVKCRHVVETCSMRYCAAPAFLRDFCVQEHGLSGSSYRMHYVFCYAIAVVFVDSGNNVTHVVGFEECCQFLVEVFRALISSECSRVLRVLLRGDCTRG